MTNNDTSGVLCLLALIALLLFNAGWGSANYTVNHDWEQRLVDDPEAIAAIRSRVLAERAEAALVKRGED